MSSVPNHPFYSIHTHSKYSVNDALPSVEAIVQKAVELGYPAIGLTDHGSVSGNVALYNTARKAGIEPLPGIELYVVPDTEYATRKDNLHLTVVAYNEIGYRNLCHLATLTQRRFWYKPRIDFADFAAMAADEATAGLAVATGCYFGVLPQVLMSRGSRAAEGVLKALAGWFPRVYVELQNHGIERQTQIGEKFHDFTDDELCEQLFSLANTVGLPVVVTRDSHYVEEYEKPLHEALKRLVAYDDGNDATFPGGGYFMTDAAGLAEYFEPKYLAAGLDGLADLVMAANVRLPELETFSLHIPDVLPGLDPQVWLEEAVMEVYGLSLLPEHPYLETIRKELNVLWKQGMAPYIVLVDKVCQFMRDNEISYHTRGSATGSLVCWLLRITQLDPIAYGLRFDRFLSSNRMKPPDVDLDVEFSRRDEVIAFLNANWAVQAIGSHMKYSLFDDDGDADSGHGSLKVKYYTNLSRQGLPRPKTWQHVYPPDKKLLYKLADKKLISGFGTHAAGLIIAPDAAELATLPLAWIASSKKFVTAYDQKGVEKLGFLKLDVLGSRVRTAIKEMEASSGVAFDTIPDNDPETMQMIGHGQTIGIFQLEGYSAKRGCMKLRPKKVNDIIAAMALFRPAVQNSGATDAFLDRRSRKATIPVRHNDIMSATKDTYGVLLYQEQVMDVMESLGMSKSELESMLTAVKASNEYSEGAAKAIADVRPRLQSLAEARGWTQIDIDWLEDSMEAYADYGFNKAHAASYGMVAYRTAYMRCHYPVNFWHGMLVAHANAPKIKGKPRKEDVYIAEARQDEVDLLPVHVNHSSVSYTIDSGAIRLGFMSIVGIGPESAKELAAKAPFTSLADMGERLLATKVGGVKPLALHTPPADCGGKIGLLYEERALEGLE